jgi:sporulation protein YlmC with PRC-barrel domain
MMPKQYQIENLRGTDAYAANGEKIGKVGEMYLDDQTWKPEWVTVKTGIFGSHESFVPLSDAHVTRDGLTLSHDKETVKDAPRVAAGGHLTPDEERQLFAHYGLSYSEGDYLVGKVGRCDGSTGEHATGTTTADAITRSEERVDIGTQTGAAGRARLRKYVITENETHTVPVHRGKPVLETEPAEGVIASSSSSRR